MCMYIYIYTKIHSGTPRNTVSLNDMQHPPPLAFASLPPPREVQSLNGFGDAVLYGLGGAFSRPKSHTLDTSYIQQLNDTNTVSQQRKKKRR